jgi:glycosyltransferase involved in cell wall biosynthesis
MTYGGAERIVYDIVNRLSLLKTRVNLFVWRQSTPSYPLVFSNNISVIELEGAKRLEKLRLIATHVLKSPSRAIFTHLIPTKNLVYLWNVGVSTIPVIHNTKEGWEDPANAFNNSSVPFVVACCDNVSAQLSHEGCNRKLVTIRHRAIRDGLTDFVATRLSVRAMYGIDDDSFVIGMVGAFRPQKAYSRALDILIQIRKHLPARLMIIGGWSNSINAKEYQEFLLKAIANNVENHITVTGNSFPVDDFYHAFDIYLNCSDHEGLSIATLEAIEFSVPIVVSNVGGQNEVVRDASSLVNNPSDITSYIDRILESAYIPPPFSNNQHREPDLIPKIWCLLGHIGTLLKPPRNGILFIANNLNPGGSQGSLTRLLTNPLFKKNSYVCLVSEVIHTFNVEKLREAGIPIWSLYATRELSSKAECLISLISSLDISTICFWDVKPELKLLISKILSISTLRIVDVSPGSMYFEQLECTEHFQHEIAWSADQYFQRLSWYVYKYNDGLPSRYAGRLENRNKLIPNGVPVVPRKITSPPQDIPISFNPRYLIGTCCRLSPVKRIDWLIEVLHILTQSLPEVSLVIVGGYLPAQKDYWMTIEALVAEKKLNNIYFPGHVDDVRPYLYCMKVFLMVSEPGGCPNASLEAMAAGLPIVATRYGGALDQVDDEVNGYLVSPSDPRDMAVRVESLLRDCDKRQHMGTESIKKVAQSFSMEKMINNYMQVFQSETL